MISRIDTTFIEITTLPPFDPASADYNEQIHRLAEFGCRLNNRVAVSLSETETGKWWPASDAPKAKTLAEGVVNTLEGRGVIKQKIMLFACAMP